MSQSRGGRGAGFESGPQSSDVDCTPAGTGATAASPRRPRDQTRCKPGAKPVQSRCKPGHHRVSIGSSSGHHRVWQAGRWENPAWELRKPPMAMGLIHPSPAAAPLFCRPSPRHTLSCFGDTRARLSRPGCPHGPLFSDLKIGQSEVPSAESVARRSAPPNQRGTEGPGPSGIWGLSPNPRAKSSWTVPEG
jgi:hypothetical protein